jgi:hypothetical protein
MTEKDPELLNAEKELLKNPLWQKTDDAVGLIPTFPLVCPFCLNARGKESHMVLRRSNIHRVADVRIKFGINEHRPYAFDNAYKCPDCGYYCVFGIATDMEYALETIKRRDNKAEYILPEELWDQDERIKERLSQLGYWGGGGEW